MTEFSQRETTNSVDGIVNRWPAVGLALGVVRDAGLESFSSHGVANIGSTAPVSEDTVFRIGSITKTFTAVAVMQLCEQGLIALDAPARRRHEHWCDGRSNCVTRTAPRRLAWDCRSRPWIATPLD